MQWGGEEVGKSSEGVSNNVRVKDVSSVQTMLIANGEKRVRGDKLQ